MQGKEKRKKNWKKKSKKIKINKFKINKLFLQAQIHITYLSLVR